MTISPNAMDNADWYFFILLISNLTMLYGFVNVAFKKAQPRLFSMVAWADNESPG